MEENMPDRNETEEQARSEHAGDGDDLDETQEIVTERPRHVYDWEKQAARLPPFDIWKDLI